MARPSIVEPWITVTRMYRRCGDTPRQAVRFKYAISGPEAAMDVTIRRCPAIFLPCKLELYPINTSSHLSPVLNYSMCRARAMNTVAADLVTVTIFRRLTNRHSSRTSPYCCSLPTCCWLECRPAILRPCEYTLGAAPACLRRIKGLHYDKS